MTARLPDVTALGQRPVGQPRRGYAGAGSLGPTPEYRPVAPRGELAMAAATEGLGESALRAGIRITDQEKIKQDRQDRYDAAAAESAFLQAKVKLDAAFDNDPDYQTYGERYEKGIKEAREKAAALIKNPERRALFDVESAKYETDGIVKIGQKAQAKERDVNRGYLLDTIDANTNAALEAKDEATRNALLLSTGSSLQAAREKGYLSYEEEARWRQATTEKFAERWVNTLSDTQLLNLLAPKAMSQQPAKAGDKYFDRLAQVESGGDANAVNKKSGALGKYQFLPSTAKQYGIDPTDLEQAEDGIRRFRADNQATLSKALGRRPSEPEEYLAHQQGAGGALALLRNPDRPAIEVLTEAHKGDKAKAMSALVDNGGTVGMTAGEFAAKQQARFAGTRPASEYQVVRNGETFGFQKTGTLVDFLPADKRAQILDGVLRRSASIEEREEKRAKERLRELGDQAEKDLADISQAGRLDVEAVQQRRSVLSPSAYNTWLKAANPEADQIKDNRDAVARLELMLDTPEAATEIDREFALNNLSIATYRAMREKNRSLLKDDRPDSPYKAGRAFLSDALDPGQLGGEATMQQPLRIARQRALSDYDAWIEANPKVSRSTAMQKAEEFLERYQTVGFGEMRQALPRPRGFTGNKREVQPPDIQAARDAVLLDLDGGKMSKDQAARELDALDVWDKVLTKARK